uniref:Small RNA binding exonuclease protection factor La n=1 Tax=Molossus molossus TaxID=27622 RepID=A0A7J8FU68_MOLMO|nr:small RNA binding exonuclease protection factor La [Molossus molossus]
MGSTRWRCRKRSIEKNHRRSTRIPKQMEVKRSQI